MAMNAQSEQAPAAMTNHAPAWRSRPWLRGLGTRFFSEVAAQPLPAPHWVAVSERLAGELGLQAWLRSQEALQVLAGNTPPPAGTLASVYSGHQFGVWAGQLGDGRALLLGEVDTPSGTQELQLKGSGLTPYSRMGDGRAVLRSSIREFLCSEAMHALSIPTTRALAVVGSPLPVRRESIETAAVVTRVAPSFLRFGHFEHFTHTAQDVAALRTLADAAIDAWFPALSGRADRVVALLEEVARRTARLVAQWQCVGFCHGVMNTDNMSLLGLTIDYGPFGFLDAFDPGHICNHSDHQGRYAYARQPNIALWNLHALAHALLPLVAEEMGATLGGADDEAVQQRAVAALEPYKAGFAGAMLNGLRAKLGLATAQEGDRELADDLLRRMAADRTDFTITFRRLAQFATAESTEGPGNAANDAVRDLFIDRLAFDAWGTRYAARLRAEGRTGTQADRERAAEMNRVNPKFVLRNHLAEVAIRRARDGDFSEVRRLHALLSRPFDEQPEHEADAGFPPEWAGGLEVSCSS
jgi:uncharacterized protein YdiU (UPF0061 family)